jgi:hypothetical protein
MSAKRRREEGHINLKETLDSDLVICPSCYFVAAIVVDLEGKSPTHLGHPAPARGAYRDRHGRWAREAVDATARGRTAHVADGEVVWS